MANWHFIDDDGSFELADPEYTRYLYFPLANEAGMLSSITPALHGDAKTGQNSFLIAPVSAEDLHESRAARNFWVSAGGEAWSAAGNSAAQLAARFVSPRREHAVLQAGPLWQRVTRTSAALDLRADVTSVVPAGPDAVELMHVRLTNTGPHALTLTPTAAIPLYARSADNLRDHRHVTSLLQRIATHPFGVSVCPTLSFDERGHTRNTLTYAVLGCEQDGTPPAGFFPVLQDFTGEAGTLDWPAAVVQGLPACAPGLEFAGYEAMGALRFAAVTLAPGESRAYTLIMAIAAAPDLDALVAEYGAAHFDEWLQRTRAYWHARIETLTFHTGSRDFDLWMKWVALQPVLRRLYGNSFLPHHDYGRGGRGWRDLWQDCLALLMMEPERVGPLLLDNFAGVRIDGTNATIIGARPGEFKADRNNIARVWMDHGAWPYLTARLYLDHSGDLAFLLREQGYFKDQYTHRGQGADADWTPEQGTQLRTRAGDVYRGSVLEHLLVQHLTAFFNAGAHSNLRLENADWNDALDMAAAQGESVAFSALYAGNLLELAGLARALEARGVRDVALAAELVPLLDTLGTPVDYASPASRQARLRAYCDACAHALSGEQVRVALPDLARDLAAKGEWLSAHIRTHEWITDREGFAWFNGYYDAGGRRVEGDGPHGTRITLTGQVFPIMTGVASDEQVRDAARAVERYLHDAHLGGYRLNSDFGEVFMRLGRAFGFAFGHKENGAMFSHMAVMYANALYRRGLAAEGERVLRDIYTHCRDFAAARIYPGIPEYVDARGRGMYHYLTGSASWLLLTLLTQAFGVNGRLGDLVLAPRLLPHQFDADGEAGVCTQFAGRELRVTYRNAARRAYGEYRVRRVIMDGEESAARIEDGAAVLPRAAIEALEAGRRHTLDVELD